MTRCSGGAWQKLPAAQPTGGGSYTEVARVDVITSTVTVIVEPSFDYRALVRLRSVSLLVRCNDIFYLIIFITRFGKGTVREGVSRRMHAPGNTLTTLPFRTQATTRKNTPQNATPTAFLL
jgi:hypothetical protein